MIAITDSEFNEIVSYVKQNYGVDLGKKRALIEGRLGNYIATLGFNNYHDYFEYAKKDPKGDEIVTLMNKLTTNHTYFMRESEHFDFYAEKVLPWIDQTLHTKDLRVWSAGCSSGQEPYTLAMITKNYLGSNAGQWNSKMLATDISDKALATARSGTYMKEDLDDVPKDWVRKYFHQVGADKMVVNDEIKANIVYRRFNLLHQFPFKQPFQCIFCRNVMIYFDNPTKNTLVNKFYDSLLPGGYFFIGHSESLSACNHKFKYVQPSVYQK